MKYIELTGFGNNTKHLVPEKSISSIEFHPEYTKIFLLGGNSINVNEGYSTIEELINITGGEITTKSNLDRNKLQTEMWSDYNSTLSTSILENKNK